MCNFRSGMKVCCINADGSTVLHRGRVYTVLEVFLDVRPTVLGFSDTGVSLVEVEPTTSLYGFAASRFRPVVERSTETGMSILRNLLNKQSKTVREDA